MLTGFSGVYLRIPWPFMPGGRERCSCQLDRRLIMAEPEAHCSELEPSEEGRSEFVVARGQASEIFEFIEEAFDQLAVLVKRLAERARNDRVLFKRHKRIRGYSG